MIVRNRTTKFIFVFVFCPEPQPCKGKFIEDKGLHIPAPSNAWGSKRACILRAVSPTYIDMLPCQGANNARPISKAMPWAGIYWAFSPFSGNIADNHLKNYN
jgi:hypothetical protein